MDLTSRTAVVAGAASGLGLESCRALARGGARIAAFDINEAGLEALKAEFGDACITHRVDVSDEVSIEAGLDAAIEAFGAIHVSVNCAGVEGVAKTVSRGKAFPLDLWSRVIAINLTGSFNVIRLAALRMSANDPDGDSGERGVIISTASGAATQGQVGQAAYSASKAGIVGMTLPIARDLAGHGIRVVTISPGVFETPMIAGVPEAVRQSLVENAILFPNRMGRASEFGELVRHIAENAYFNGTTIALDGGARMTAR